MGYFTSFSRHSPGSQGELVGVTFSPRRRAWAMDYPLFHSDQHISRVASGLDVDSRYWAVE